jgi:hypothetical protein
MNTRSKVQLKNIVNHEFLEILLYKTNGLFYAGHLSHVIFCFYSVKFQLTLGYVNFMLVITGTHYKSDNRGTPVLYPVLRIRIRDGKKSDPGSGINIPDPQH